MLLRVIVMLARKQQSKKSARRLVIRENFTNFMHNDEIKKKVRDHSVIIKVLESHRQSEVDE